MSNLTQAVFDFKDKMGPLGHLSNKLLVNLAAQPDDHLAYQKPLSISTLKARIDFVEKGAIDYFVDNNIAPMDLKPHNNGAESLVFDCGNGYVLKMRTGESYQDPKWRKLLHATRIGHSQELNVTYGIYPVAETNTEITTKQRQSMRMKALASGYHLKDHNPYNFGFINQKTKKSLMVIDDGAVKPIESLRDVYHVAKEIFIPVYQAMPFIHPHWRNFRDSLKSMIGMEIPEKKTAQRKLLDK